MCRAFSCIVAIPIVMLAATYAGAQRDRDTYNPSNQSFEVSGQVNTSGTNEPVKNVQVRLERFSGEVIDQLNTDIRGRFRFTNLQRGYYRVIINVPGFSPAQQDADLTVLFKAYMVFSLTRTDSSMPAPYAAEVIDARIPPSARDEFAKGRAALARKKPQEAISHFQLATSLYPEFFDAQLLLGIALMDLRDWPLAENAFQRAVQIKPEHPSALIALGEVYWREKRYGEAEKMLLEGLRLDEKNWHGHFTLGRLYWEQNQVMKAAPAIGHTLQLKPDFAEAHLLAGNILLRLEQQQRALVEYREYLRLAPKGEYAAEARDLIDKLTRRASP